MCDVRTIHGTFGSNASAENHDRRTLLRIGRVGIALDRYQVHLPPTPSANSPPQGAPAPGPTAPFKPSRIDPLNREPTAKPGSTVPFKPSRIDPLNREPGAFPDPGPDQYISRMKPLVSANPRDAPHTRSQRRSQENLCRG